MPTYNFTPEMNQKKPDHRFYDIEVKSSYDYKYEIIETPLELKGRGITFLNKIDEANGYTMQRIEYKRDWNRYRVTTNAFSKLDQKYKCVRALLLD
jgi:hypothetical protein